jgi:glycosyltransferase involved in cell wall biosynthesis
MKKNMKPSTNQSIAASDDHPAPVDFKANPVVVVIPAYNEERFIGSVVLKVLKFPVTVIVVDDGSADDTAGIAMAAGATVIRHPDNRGKGQALNSGFSAARRLQPAAIVMIDGDGQHLPEQMENMVRPVLDDEADIVIGSRYLRKPEGVPRQRVIGHWFFDRVTQLSSGIQVSDSQSGYRAFSPKAYNADLFHSANFTVESEMQFLAREHGLRVVDVPITIRYTDKAKRSVWQHGMMVLNGVLRLTGMYRPLLFFAGTGFVVMVAGLGLGLIVVNIYTHVKELAVGYAILSVLLTIIGMLGISTGVILHSVRGLLTDLLQSRLDNKQD